ncbi:hypothetical protein [Ensifer adhaerens]|nr:hypothetical protein [Ensifer adhaerens]
MNDMMGSGMMWGMGLPGLLAIIVIVLMIAALIKVSVLPLNASRPPWIYRPRRRGRIQPEIAAACVWRILASSFLLP